MHLEFCRSPEKLGPEVSNEKMDEYLCLTDLLDQDLTAWEYFQTLPPAIQTTLRREDGAPSFRELQARANRLRAGEVPEPERDGFR